MSWLPLLLQIEVLKCNLEKADQEIYQLDDIVDKVVKVRVCLVGTAAHTVRAVP